MAYYCHLVIIIGYYNKEAELKNPVKDESCLD